MAREEVPLDQETYDRVLAAELGKGTSQRVAEGRARSAAVRAYRAAHGEPAPRPAASRPAAAAAAAAGGDGAGGNGAGGDGAGAPAQAPVPAGVAAAAGAPAGPAAARLA